LKRFDLRNRRSAAFCGGQQVALYVCMMFRTSDLAIDDALSASFPASDPPPWNSGFASLVAVETPGINRRSALGSPGVIYVSSPPEFDLTLRSAVVSVVIAAGIAFLAPLAVLLVGLPVALAVRSLLEVLLWVL
jgi:hypothetical protein